MSKGTKPKRSTFGAVGNHDSPAFICLAPTRPILPTYSLGELVELRAAITTRLLTALEAATFVQANAIPDGIAAAPEQVVCTVRSPGRSTSTPKVATVAPGIYRSVFTPDSAGIHHFAFDGKGTYVASGEGSFTVRRQQVPR